MTDSNTADARELLFQATGRVVPSYARIVLPGASVLFMHTRCFAKGLLAGLRQNSSFELTWNRPNRTPCPGCGR